MDYVSRAGEKLEFALKYFKIDVSGIVVADFGSSTGGFVDCLLQNKAKKVYSVDTCYGELAWKLRQDERVVVMEKTNAMHVKIPELVDLVTIDTAWTKQEFVLPNAVKNLKKGGKIISLLKPHYEASKQDLVKGVLSPEMAEKTAQNVVQSLKTHGFNVIGIVKSPITGSRAGNTEFLILIQNF